MANWLEITNTFINLETMQRVGDLSRAQQQVADHMVATELRKQNDNALLSQLVDVVVKVRQFIQDRQFLDALLSAGVGALAFKHLYPQIIDADTKLKASDIQVKLLETIRQTISDDSIKQSILISLAQYLTTFSRLLENTLTEFEQSHHQLVWLNPKEEWKIDIGEEFTPIQDIIDPTTKINIFRKGNLYRVINVDTIGKKGFYLTNDFGQNWHLFFGNNGGADLFAFFDPPLPSLEKEVASWELCDGLFKDDFLQENLKSVRLQMLELYQQSYDRANIVKNKISQAVLGYRNIRQQILNKALQSPELQALADIKKSETSSIIWTIISLIVIIVFLIRHC
jgi:hypothetical protein